MAAFGSNNNNNKGYEQEYYSYYTMTNPESLVDQTKLSFAFWAKKLKVTISPKKKGEDFAWDYDNNIAVYLTHTKARILSELIKTKLQQDPEVHSVGVPSGSNGLIYVSDGTDYNVDTPCITVASTNNETGEIESMFVYQCSKGKHYGIINYDKDNKSCQTIDMDNVDLDEFIQTLDSYVSAATGAIAYTVADTLKYNFSRLNTKTDSICEKLGISFGKDKANFSKGGSYFDKNRTGDAMPKPDNVTMDDLDDGLN